MRIDQLERAVQKLAPQTWFWYKDQAMIAELVKIVDDSNFPVEIEWQGLFKDVLEDETEYGDSGHYSVVTMVDLSRHKLVIVDPYKDFRSQDRIFTLEFFKSSWWDKNNYPDPQTGNDRLDEDRQMM